MNHSKTHVFATTAQGRKTLAAGPFDVVTGDKLLGAQISFTRKRSRKIANHNVPKPVARWPSGSPCAH